MPLALLVVGAVILTTAINGNVTALGKQLRLDFVGDGTANNKGFIVWVIILAILGGIGSISQTYGRNDIKQMSQLFMAIILAALVLKQPNIFQSFVQQITAGPISPATDASASATTSGGSSSNAQQGGSGNDTLSEVGSTVMHVLPYLAMA